MSNTKLIIVGAGIVGALAGRWWKSMEIEESKKNRSEREDPELVNEVCSKVKDLLLEGLEILDDIEDEDDFRDLLYEHLDKETDFAIAVAPNTQFGQPDILIEDVLALEVKHNPNKAEMDRCIGQCANYSREWVTCIILYDTTDSQINYLHEVLISKGLDNITIIPFFYSEDEEDSTNE